MSKGKNLSNLNRFWESPLGPISFTIIGCTITGIGVDVKIASISFFGVAIALVGIGTSINRY